MPSVNALAGASLTPGGVASGLSDLVSALVNAPIQRRQIEMQQAAQLAQQQMAQQRLGLDQDTLAETGRYHDQQALNDAAQQKRLAAGQVLDYTGGIERATIAAGGHGKDPTFFDAYDHIPAELSMPNPDKSPQAQLFAPTIKQPVPNAQRIQMAQEALNAANQFKPAGGMIPTHVLQGRSSPSDPATQQALDALMQMGGMTPPAQAPTTAAPPTPVNISEAAAAASQNKTGANTAGATTAPAQAPAAPAAAPAQKPAGKVITQAQIQAKLKPGWDLQKAVAYYQSLGYTVQ